MNITKREVIILVISLCIFLLSGVSILNKRNNFEMTETKQNFTQDSLFRIREYEDSLIMSETHIIQSRIINDKEYYIFKDGKVTYEVDYFDSILNQVLKIEFSDYSIKIDSNYKEPHLTGINLSYGKEESTLRNRRYVSNPIILYSKRQLPIFIYTQ
jgi:hypothetical protein